MENFGDNIFKVYFDLMNLEGFQILNILKIHRQIQNVYNLQNIKDKLVSIDYCTNTKENLDSLKYHMISDIFFHQVNYKIILELCEL